MINMRTSTIDDMALAKNLALENYIGDYALVREDDPNRYVSFIADGFLLGVLTVTEMNRGVAHVGAILTKHIYKYPISFARYLKTLLSRKMEELDIHRAQIEVVVGYDAGHRFARALGFKPEGKMEKYGSDQKDYILYARIK